MKVKDAVKMLRYAEKYYLIGAHKGKIYHRSWVNQDKHIEKFLDEEVYDNPFFADIYVNEYVPKNAYPVIGIWMCDYHFYHKEDKDNGEQ